MIFIFPPSPTCYIAYFQLYIFNLNPSLVLSLFTHLIAWWQPGDEQISQIINGYLLDHHILKRIIEMLKLTQNCSLVVYRSNLKNPRWRRLTHPAKIYVL